VQPISQTKSSVFGLGVQKGFGDDFANEFLFMPRNDEDKRIRNAIIEKNLWAIICHNSQVVSAVHASCHPDGTILFEYCLPPTILPGTELSLKVFHLDANVTPKPITFRCEGITYLFYYIFPL
jgi:hypothetical protein